MQKKTGVGTVVIFIIVFILICTGTGYVIYQGVTNKNGGNGNQNNGEVVTDELTGRKFILNKDNNSYLGFEGNKKYIKYSESTETGIAKIKGQYKLENNLVTLSNDVRKIYLKGMFLLVQIINESSDTKYELYVDSTKYDQFIKNVSSDIPTFLTNEINMSDSELKNVLEKVEIQKVGNCWVDKSDLNSDKINCSLIYNVYLKDYDKNKASEYEKYFAGSAPEFKENYVERYFSIALEGNNGKYKPIATFTGE